ncbi:MAG: glucosaminidase domain-containing protein [Methylococcales bacterium]|nr:glucosaminidase domain-containing protein [Methylococcales bacterium]
MSKTDDFIKKCTIPAQESERDAGVPTAITIAQACVESGWGEHHIGEANNYFGVKAQKGEDSVSVETKEFVHGKYITIAASFKKYKSMQDSFVDHGRFLKNNARYASILFEYAKTGNSDDFARGLQKAGYATDPKYAELLINIMTSHKLYALNIKQGANIKTAKDFQAKNDAVNTMNLTASVGQDGVNHKPDVERVQAMLLLHRFTPGPVDGLCGKKTINAIIAFQKTFLPHPDGLIDVKGKTWQMLSLKPLAHKSPQEASAYKWSGDSSQWSQEQKLESLNPIFREKVKTLLEKMKGRGFLPKIFYGWRSVAVQLDLYNKKRTKVKFSFHNAQLPNKTPNSYAADIVDKRWGWGNDAEKNGYWKAIGEEANKLGLVWGGDWKGFRDVAHVQGRKNSELSVVKKESGL